MLPGMVRIRQLLAGERISGIDAEISRCFSGSELKDRIKPGMRVAVAVGSRGIKNISFIVKRVTQELKNLGAEVYIIPAMGSHGGATARGQIKVLQNLGIDEERMGVPIRANMETAEIGTTPDGVPVYLGEDVLEADGYFLVNRVKAHTDFKGDYESGIIKMLTVGLGKHRGCVNLHTHGLAKYIPAAAKVAVEKTAFLGGLAILENSREETAQIEILLPANLFSREKELLIKAKAMMGKLPFAGLDVLVVKEMGKTISGTGLDTNIIGRLKIEGEPETGTPCIKRIVVLDLRGDSYGNALGVGLADFTTRRLVDKIDYSSMYANVISTSYLERGKIPITLSSDREAVEAALTTIGPIPREGARLAVIKNTLELEEIYISRTLLPFCPAGSVEIGEDIGALPFDSEGRLILFD